MKTSVLADMFDPRRFTMEHRWGQRAACRHAVRISTSAGNESAGRLRDVSLSGAFVETEIPLPLFAKIELNVVPSALGDHEVTVMAIVVRLEDDGVGVGVEWGEMPAGSVCAMLGCTQRCAAATVPR